MVEPPDNDLFVSHAEADRAWVEGYLLDALAAAGVRVHSEAAFTPASRACSSSSGPSAEPRSLLVLSPAYLADDYAAFADLLAQTYGLETGTWPVVPLLLHPGRPAAPAGDAHRVRRTDPAGRERPSRGCGRPAPPPAPPAPGPPCPYPGMRPFAESGGPLSSTGGRRRSRSCCSGCAGTRSWPSSVPPAPASPRSSSPAWSRPCGEQALRSRPTGWSSRCGPAPPRWRRPPAALGATQASRRIVRLRLGGPAAARRLLLVVDQFEELFTARPARRKQCRFQEALRRWPRAATATWC